MKLVRLYIEQTIVNLFIYRYIHDHKLMSSSSTTFDYDPSILPNFPHNDSFNHYTSLDDFLIHGIETYIQTGNLEGIRSVFRVYPDFIPNSKKKYRNLIGSACETSNLEIASYLHSKGADPRLRDNFGRSILYVFLYFILIFVLKLFWLNHA